MLLLRLPGSFLLRFDTRAFLGLLFQEPPIFYYVLVSLQPHFHAGKLGPVGRKADSEYSDARDHEWSGIS